jgi:hypothetical protein
MIDAHTSGPWELQQIAEDNDIGPELIALRLRDEDVLVITRDEGPQLITALMSYLQLEMVGPV